MSLCPYCGSPVTDGKACTVCGAVLTTPHLPLGTRLASGRYSLGRVLGQGGFGITYQGADLMLARPIAIKECFPDGSVRLPTQTLQPPVSAGTQGFRQALDGFINEGRTLARFNDPGIMRVLDVFEEHGTAYLAMEYLQGETLAARIARAGALDPVTVADIAQKVARALDLVHAAGVLHRDIKPDNLFCTSDGRMVLIDFGAARGFNQEQTVRHTRMVTEGYAPLEQYATQARFGPYTDLYALAATLYHALSGSPPVGANDRVLGTVLQPLPAAVPAALRETITRALALQIAERPQNVAEFLRLLSGSPAAPRPQLPSPSSTASHPSPAGGESCTVMLDTAGPFKINVIKAVRAELGCGLQAAYDLVNSAPTPLVENLSTARAHALAANLRASGALVTVFTGLPTPSTAPSPLPPTPAPVPTTDGANYTVVLDRLGHNPLAVIKVVHAELGYDLNSASNLVYAPAPVTIARGLPARATETLVGRLRAEGAAVRITEEPGSAPRAFAPDPPPATGYVVTLEEPGASKTETIKTIWDALEIKLQQAKWLVEHTPSKMGVPDKALADQLVAKLTRVGAHATARPAS